MIDKLSLQFISNDDLFKLLIHRVPNFYLEADRCKVENGQQIYKPISMYKESVNVLESLERFVIDLKEGALPSVDKVILKSKHLPSNNEYLKYFDDLKFLDDMFDTTYLQLSQNWQRYIDFLTGDWEGIGRYQNSEFIKNVPYINFIGQPDYTQQWDPWRFSREKAIRLQHAFLKNIDVDSESLDYKQKLQEACQQFDELLNKHQKLYTFAVDLRFIRSLNMENKEPLGILLEKVMKDREAIQFFLTQQVSDVFQIYTKLEHDFQNGLKLSCIFICKSNVESNHNTLISELNECLAQAFQQYRIEVINGNKIIKKHAHEQAIGLIKRKDKEQIKLFKYWVLSYFYRIDSFVKLIHPTKEYEINNILINSIKGLCEEAPAFGNAKKKKIDSFADVLYSWKSPASIWKLSYVPQRLNVSHIFYKELCAEFGAPQYGELLFQIQVLIETMLKKNDMAFSTFHNDEQVIVNKKELRERSSVLGLQFLYVLQQLSSYPNVLINLNKLCGQINCGLGLKEIKIFISNVTYIFDLSYKTHPLRINHLEQFNQSLLGIKHQIILENNGNIPHKNNYQYSYDLFSRRKNEATKYIDFVLEQDCLAHRVIITAEIDHDDFQQAEFSKLFTDFMRLAKRAKPCSWLRGYMGIWQENMTSSKFEIDVILFFSEKGYPEKGRIVEMLHTNWQKFLKEKAKNLLEWDHIEDKKDLNFYGSINSKILMHSIKAFNRKEYHTQGIYFEASKLKTKKLFQEQVIPFFAYRDFFRPALTQKVPKVFIKGGTGKKKSA